MERSVLLFESAGIAVIPAATDYSTARFDPYRPLSWLPDASCMRSTDRAIKEWLGIAVDRLRGRIRAVPN